MGARDVTAVNGMGRGFPDGLRGWNCQMGLSWVRSRDTLISIAFA
jgi:hypothetical protein